jgi:hypothetical protein
MYICLPNVIFPSGFPTNILHVFLVSPILATCIVHLILLDLIIQLHLAMSTRYEASRYAVHKNNIQILIILTAYIDFDLKGSIYFQLRAIASTLNMKVLTHHTVQQF